MIDAFNWRANRGWARRRPGHVLALGGDRFLHRRRGLRRDLLELAGRPGGTLVATSAPGSGAPEGASTDAASEGAHLAGRMLIFFSDDPLSPTSILSAAG